MTRLLSRHLNWIGITANVHWLVTQRREWWSENRKRDFTSRDSDIVAPSVIQDEKNENLYNYIRFPKNYVNCYDNNDVSIGEYQLRIS